jgi:hypothetical protein
MPILLASYKNKTAGFVLRDSKKPITIGRDPGNDMPLPLTRVSRVHASLTRRGHEWFIRDLGSSNGTKVNNVKICGTVQIKSGDRLRLGNVRMQFLDKQTIPEGIKRLKDRRDNTQRIRFKCKYCNHIIKAMERDAGRRVQCSHCDQVVHIPGHVIGKTSKTQQRPEAPLSMCAADPKEQSQMIDHGQLQAVNNEAVTVDDLHDELAQMAPERAEQYKEVAQDQAQAMRQLRKAEIKKELFRDDRNVVEKLYSRMLINFVLQYSKLKDPTFPVRRWHVATMAMVLMTFFSMRLILGGGAATVEAAPSQFPVTCTNCQHESQMELARFEQLSFYMMHPDSFNQKYPDQTAPEPAVCEACGKQAVALRLTVDPDSGLRRVVAVTDVNSTVQMAKAQ